MVNKIATLIVVGVLSLAGLILFGYNEFITKDTLQDQPVAYEIIYEWELPKELDEVSGIDWIGDNKLACIQDEDGIIFIFNLETSKVEKSIEFAGAGDYEDIRIVGQTAYVLRSDGEIFEVSDFLSGNSKTKTYSNFLSEKQNLESLAWDKNNKRLLLAIKDRELKDDNYKGVYQFSLTNKELERNPLYRLNMQDSLLRERETKLNKKLQPSALSIHPKNKDFYILDGRAPQLVIANSDMKLKKRYALHEDDFEQAEGLTFSKNGRLFISNEGKGGKANILEVIFK
ncbi:SdiA-regulated domain-containing protein [Salegentibacter sp. BDJ18]|uniref:SdiA-regulated domain-containing protein n=1 Tax=Salegentibacter sp. BDJ18 TaxID=2816376 RepID=UPI001AAE1FB3|nr:SdiA-regulated domain-containing protein [Salegentibacter sp. BDJ18]MBO2546041.1 SdiA-regulated domain-containing protein [Salegentibacter sp. BDJ18]